MMTSGNFMKKTIIFIALTFCINYAQAQWQEITKYGQVRDFLYIDSNLQYVWGDTNYIVENGQIRMVADFGFKKKNGDIWTPDQADFVKGTRIGYKFKIYSDPARLEVLRTIDGGINWSTFADHTFPDYESLWMIPIAIDSEAVYFEGRYYSFKPIPGDYPLPFIKIKKNNKIDIIYPKVFYKGNWVKTDTAGANILTDLYFFDSLYGIGFLHGPNSMIKTGWVRTFDGGNNFFYLDSVMDKSNGKILPVTKAILYTIDQYSISNSSDSGFTWNWIKRNKNINNHLDTLFSGLSISNDQIFYLKGNIFTSPNQTVSYVYHKNLVNPYFDSVEVKPVKYIECFDNARCYMYGDHFYINNNPIEHPLSDKEILEKQDIKPKLIYYADQIELFFPPNEQNNQFQLMLYDMSGKLLLTTQIPKQTQNYELRLNESLPQGIYIISLRSNNGAYSLKFIK